MDYASLAGGGLGAVIVAFAILTDGRSRQWRYALAVLGAVLMITFWLVLS